MILFGGWGLFLNVVLHTFIQWFKPSALMQHASTDVNAPKPHTQKCEHRIGSIRAFEVRQHIDANSRIRETQTRVLLICLQEFAVRVGPLGSKSSLISKKDLGVRLVEYTFCPSQLRPLGSCDENTSFSVAGSQALRIYWFGRRCAFRLANE